MTKGATGRGRQAPTGRIKFSFTSTSAFGWRRGGSSADEETPRALRGRGMIREGPERMNRDERTT